MSAAGNESRLSKLDCFESYNLIKPQDVTSFFTCVVLHRMYGHVLKFQPDGTLKCYFSYENSRGRLHGNDIIMVASVVVIICI
jgi:hypothetical protein